MAIFAILATVVSSAVLYLTSPRFPLYQIKTLRLLSLDVWNLVTRQTLTLTVEAEVELYNANFLWSSVHATAVDMYYPDFDGNLRRLGQLHDKHTHLHNYQQRQVPYADDYLYFEIADNVKPKSSLRSIEAQTADEPYFVTQSNLQSTSSVPTVKRKRRRKTKNPHPVVMPPRSTVIMQDNIISVHKLPPTVYLNILYEILFQGSFGHFHMYNTGVAHVKAIVGPGNLAVPATVEVMCDNHVNALVYPARVIGRVCTPVEVVPGWMDLERTRASLGKELHSRFLHYDSVLKPYQMIWMDAGLVNGNSTLLPSVESWHDF